MSAVLDEVPAHIPKELVVNWDFYHLPSAHATFGTGPRRAKVFIEEWLKRIPDFSVYPNNSPKLEAGLVNAVPRLPLVWQAWVTHREGKH